MSDEIIEFVHCNIFYIKFFLFKKKMEKIRKNF